MEGIDTNILLYAYDSSSPFHREAGALIEDLCTRGSVAITQLSLLEFYSVITDSRKIGAPLSPQEATGIVGDIFSAEEFVVLYGNEAVDRFSVQYASARNLTRFHIYDVYIAGTFEFHGVRKVYTANISDFKKFDFIEAVNPFTHSATSIARSENAET